MDDEKIALAGELALGLLQGRDRQEALHQVNIDPEMRAALWQWEEDFASSFLASSELDAVPPTRIWQGVEAHLFGAPVAPLWKRMLDGLAAPDNRGVVISVALAKLALLAWLIYLFF